MTANRGHGLGTRRHRAAVVGLGKIAQLKYLPQIARHPAFELVALCDQAGSLTESLGDRYGVYKHARFQKIDDLLGGCEVDVLFVLTHEHFAIASNALAHGIATFVEKPLAWCARDAQRLAASAQANELVMFPGYMRLFEPLLRRLHGHVAARGQPLSIHCRNFAGGVRRWSGSLHALEKPSAQEKAEGTQSLDAAWREFFAARGIGAETLRAAGYKALLQLGIHDLSLLAALFGPLTDVIFADCRRAPVTGGSTVVVRAELESMGGARCSLEVAPLMAAPWPWQEQIEVHYEDESLSYELGNPFLPVCTSRLRRRWLEGGAWREEIAIDSFEDPFALQLAALASRLDGDPVADLLGSDPVADLETVERVISAMPID